MFVPSILAESLALALAPRVAIALLLANGEQARSLHLAPGCAPESTIVPGNAVNFGWKIRPIVDISFSSHDEVVQSFPIP